MHAISIFNAFKHTFALLYFILQELWDYQAFCYASGKNSNPPPIVVEKLSFKATYTLPYINGEKIIGPPPYRLW